MSRPVDIGELAAVTDWLDRLVAGIRGVAFDASDAIAEVRAEQRQLRDDLGALSNRIESLARVVSDRTDHLA